MHQFPCHVLIRRSAHLVPFSEGNSRVWESDRPVIQNLIIPYLEPMEKPTLHLVPIGVVHTPFHSKYSAPRQPGTSTKRSEGVITLNAGSNFEQALKDLKGFGYVWVLFWFHENKNWKPLVLPPVSDRVKRGVFSTRSPHRPNPIGLSLCKLLDVKGRTIRIENPDMLDGTPILDIKPYLPHAESHPRAKSGWIRDAHEKKSGPFRVSYDPSVTKALSVLPELTRDEIDSYLKGTLSRDPFPHAYRRIKQLKDGSMMIAMKQWRFTYTVIGRFVRITDWANVGRSVT